MFWSVDSELYRTRLELDISHALLLVIPTMPVCFILLVAIMNLNNWVFYYFKIGDLASKLRGERNNSQTKEKVVNAVTAIAALQVVGICSFLIV